MDRQWTLMTVTAWTMDRLWMRGVKITPLAPMGVSCSLTVNGWSIDGQWTTHGYSWVHVNHIAESLDNARMDGQWMVSG